MSQQGLSVQYTFDPLSPLYNGIYAQVLPVNLQPSTIFESGRVLAKITGSANDVQTVSTSGGPGSGTFTLVGNNPLTGLNVTTAALAYNITKASLQAELVKPANFGAGNVVVSGTDGGPWTLTFGGLLAKCPVPVLALGTNALNTGSIAVAHTTIGFTAGTFGKYDSTVASPPPIPVPTGTGSGSAFAAGTYLVQVTGVNAQGETTASPAAPVTLTAAQKIRVAALATGSTSFTTLNVYVNGVLVGPATVTAGTSTQTDFDVAALGVSGVLPDINTAYLDTNGTGSHVAVALLKYGGQTDAAGNFSFSGTTSVGEWGQVAESNQAYFAGIFDVTKVVGLDAKAVRDLGRLWDNSLTFGALRVF